MFRCSLCWSSGRFILVTRKIQFNLKTATIDTEMVSLPVSAIRAWAALVSRWGGGVDGLPQGRKLLGSGF